MGYSLRCVGPNDTVSGLLPDFTKLQVSAILADFGSVSFDYVIGGVNYDWLKDQQEFSLWDDQGELDNCRFVIEGSNYNKVSADGSQTRTFTGRTVAKSLEESVVYVPNWPNPSGLQSPANGYADGLKVNFTNATPGTILITLFNKAKQFSEMNRIDPTWTFREDVDSNGKPWAMTLTVSYDQGTSLAQVVQDLVSYGAIEYNFRRRLMYVTNAGGTGGDRSNLTFPNSKNVIEVPEKTDSTGIRTVAIVKGDNDIWQEVVDGNAVSQYGRRVIYMTLGGADQQTMIKAGQAALDSSKNVKRERTYKYHLASPGVGLQPLIPHRDFMLGDWVYEESDGAFDRVRVRQITLEIGQADAEATATLTMNDMLLEWEIRQSRKTTAMSGGANSTNGSQPTPPPPSIITDTMPPAVVGQPNFTSELYTDAGTLRKWNRIKIAWPAVTTNDDGTPISDLNHYEVQWIYGSAPAPGSGDQGWSPIQTSDTNALTIPNFGLDVDVTVRVRARDNNNNASKAWSPTYTGHTGKNSTPLGIPSSLSVGAYLGTLRITYDGKDSSGTAMPASLDLVEVYSGSTSTFTVAQGTLLGTLGTAGSLIYRGTYGTQVFFRSRSKDIDGNYSALSTAVPGTPTPLVNADLGPNSVANLQIQNLAVNDAKISDLSVATLTSGVLHADMILSSNIQTAATGQRVVMNSLGIRQYDSAGNIAVNIAPSGSLFKGTISASTFTSIGAASGGANYIIIGSASRNEPGNDEIRFTLNNDTSGASIRSPLGNPGRLRFSTRDWNQQTGVVDIDSDDGLVVWRVTFGYGADTVTAYNNAYFEPLTSWPGNYASGQTQGKLIALWPGQFFQSTYSLGGMAMGIIDGHSTGVTSWDGTFHYTIGAGTNALVFSRNQDYVSIRSNDNVYYHSIRASSFDVNSTEAVKSSIKPLDLDVMDAIRRAKMHVWDWKRSEVGNESRSAIGMILEHLPAWATAEGGGEVVSLHTLLAIVWEACRSLDSEVQMLRDRVGLPVIDPVPTTMIGAN